MELLDFLKTLMADTHPRMKIMFEEIDFMQQLQNTVIFSLVTSLFGIIGVTYWVYNRQTQITKSKSQQKRRKHRNRGESIADGDTQLSHSESEQDLYFNDWTRSEHRRSLINSIHGGGDDDDDEDNADDKLEASDDEQSDDNESDFDGVNGSKTENNHLRRVSSATSLPQKKMRADLFKAISKLKVFSYLSDDAFLRSLALMEYVDLQKAGMEVFETKPYDGSLYVVLEGNVDVHCGLQCTHNGSKQNFMSLSAGPGDLMTSLLSALSGLIEEYHASQGKTNVNFQKIQVRATTSEDNTRLIRIPPNAFVSMLQISPHDVYQVTQTIFARCQRVTIQTLVKNLGLGYEMLYSHGTNMDQIPNKQNESANSNSTREMDNKSNELALIAKEVASSTKKNSGKDHTILFDVKVEVMEKVATLFSRALGSTSPSAIDIMKQEIKIVMVEPGEVLLDAEAKSNYAYFVLDGSIAVTCANNNDEQGVRTSMGSDVTSEPYRQLYEVGPGDTLGILSCFIDENSFITLRSPAEKKSITLLALLPKKIFRSLLDKHPEILIESISKILKVDFSPLVHLMEWGVDWMHVQAGTVIARTGDICDKLQVVLSGRLQALPKTRRKYENSSNVKAEEEYGRGTCVGEALVLLGGKWPHDIYAVRNSEIALLRTNVLEYIMNMFPHTAVYLAKRIAARQVQHKHRHRKATSPFSFNQEDLSVATLAIVPLCFDSSHDAHDLCKHITGALGKIEPCTLMTKSLARKHLGNKVFKMRNAVHQLKMSRLLGDLEEKKPLTVYETDSKFTWWTKLCIQQADCVILVIDGENVPKCTNLERYLSWAYDKSLVRHVQILLLQDVKLSGKNPSSEARVPSIKRDVSAWIESRHFIEGQHLVRRPIESFENDVARLCRRITGRSLGLALGGGGARGKFPAKKSRVDCPLCTFLIQTKFI